MKLPTDEAGRLLHSSKGAHVMMHHNGRRLLGEVVAVRTADDDGERMRVLCVRHFNGEPWPAEPLILAVDVLERDYPDEEST